MGPATGFSDAKRTLLEKYLRGGAVPASVIPARARSAPAPLLPSQAQLYVRELRLGGIPPLYNECIAIRMQGAIDSTKLERAFNQIIQRHEIWRTTFEAGLGQPVQVIHECMPVHFVHSDVAGLAEDMRATEALRIVAETARQPFQLDKGPLLRPILVRLRDSEHWLYVIAHQIILDGMSAYQIFPTELAAIYRSLCTGETVNLPELPIQYGDFAVWQRESLTASRQRQVTYWRRQLEGLPRSTWPRSKSAGAAPSFIGRIRPFTFTRELSEAVRALAQRSGTTLFVALLAGFAKVLHGYTKNESIVIGTPSPSGRKHSEVTPLLGYFLNPVALRLEFAGQPHFAELLAQARIVLADALSHDDVPIEELARELRAQDDGSLSPLFTAAMSLQPQTPDLGMPWTVTSMDVESGGSPWKLYLAFINMPDKIIGRAQFDPNLFSEEEVGRLLHDLEIVLQDACRELQA